MHNSNITRILHSDNYVIVILTMMVTAIVTVIVTKIVIATVTVTVTLIVIVDCDSHSQSNVI